MQFRFLVPFLTLFFATGSIVVYAQEKEGFDTTSIMSISESLGFRPGVHLLARSYGDSVVLRWGPTTPDVWLAGNNGGYIVERILVDRDTSNRNDIELLTPTPLMPWTLDEWIERAPHDNQLVAVAVEMLHGDHIAVSEDGNVDVSTLYNASVEFSSRHGFALYVADLDQIAANGLAFRFVDRNVKVGEMYGYQVYLAEDPSFYGTPVDTGFALLPVTPYRSPQPPPHLRATPGDGAIKVVWDDLELSEFSGYHLYRSDNGGRTYTQLTEVPIVNASYNDSTPKRQLFYTDSAVVNYKEYTYQLRGITPFAELTAPVSSTTYARDMTPPVEPVPERPETPGGTLVLLSWTVQDTLGDLAGFEVNRAAKESGPYRSITPAGLPASARSYTVEDGNEAEAYYIITAVDTAGNLSYSHPVLGEVIDTAPPSIPVGLTGEIDTTGIVNLHWNLGPEPDIFGYNILFANDSTHEFTQLTGRPWTDTAFVDTVEVNTLTKNVYYRIVAVDTRKNHSHMSEIYELRRPDVVPPEGSVFNNVISTDSSVVLFWHPSTSDDLAGQVLLRQGPGESAPREIARLGTGVATYEDRNVKRKETYHYTLVAEDLSGLRSGPSPAVQGRPYDDGIRPGVRDLSAVYDPDRRTISLSWDYTPGSTEGKYWFVIYRGGVDGPVAQIKAVRSDERTFVDSDISRRPVYRYAVRVMSSTTESPFSNEVVVSLSR